MKKILTLVLCCFLASSAFMLFAEDVASREQIPLTTQKKESYPTDKERTEITYAEAFVEWTEETLEVYIYDTQACDIYLLDSTNSVVDFTTGSFASFSLSSLAPGLYTLYLNSPSWTATGSLHIN